MGTKIFDGLYMISNEVGQIRSITFTASTSHVHLVAALRGLQNSIHKYGLNEVEFMFTDDPEKDAGFFQRHIPSLKKDVVSLSTSKYDHLPLFDIADNVTTIIVDNEFSMETIATVITDDLVGSKQQCVVGFDMEWCSGNDIQGRVATIQLAHEDKIYILRVSVYLDNDIDHKMV